MASGDWKDQYTRMIRWRKRLDKLTSGDGKEIQDYFFAFFLNCYHLGDWLFEVRDDFGKSDFEQGEVNDFRHKNDEYLKVCHGVANGLKHFYLDKKRYYYPAGHYRTHIKTHDALINTSSTGSSTTSENPYQGGFDPSVLQPGDYIVAVDGKTISMIDLADKCIASWNSFLISKNITPPACS